MRNMSNTIATAIGALIGLSSAAANAVDVKCAEQERCYGVVKAGKNDCGTSTSACTGSAKQDFQKDAWILVPKGTCARLAGSAGTVAPADPSKKK